MFWLCTREIQFSQKTYDRSRKTQIATITLQFIIIYFWNLKENEYEQTKI